jgi:sn-glycerol 3-phosphate transport system permease protein
MAAADPSGHPAHRLHALPRRRNDFSFCFSTGTVVRPSKFVGLANYAALGADPIFWKVLGNNLVFAAATIPTSIALALLMAIWVNDKLPGRALVRLSYFTPTILPMVAVANLWLFFYTPQIGMLDQVGALFGAKSHNWLGDPHLVMSALSIMTIWKEAGFFMIFYLAALQSLSPDLEEAAKIEGASRWYFFRRVTFPLLMPTTLFVLVNATINSFKLVDHLFILTKGGPDNAQSICCTTSTRSRSASSTRLMPAALTAVLLALLAALAACSSCSSISGFTTDEAPGNHRCVAPGHCLGGSTPLRLLGRDTSRSPSRLISTSLPLSLSTISARPGPTHHSRAISSTP